VSQYDPDETIHPPALNFLERPMTRDEWEALQARIAQLPPPPQLDLGPSPWDLPAPPYGAGAPPCAVPGAPPCSAGAPPRSAGAPPCAVPGAPPCAVPAVGVVRQKRLTARQFAKNGEFAPGAAGTAGR